MILKLSYYLARLKILNLIVHSPKFSYYPAHLMILNFIVHSPKCSQQTQGELIDNNLSPATGVDGHDQPSNLLTISP